MYSGTGVYYVSGWETHWVPLTHGDVVEIVTNSGVQAGEEVSILVNPDRAECYTGESSQS